MRLELTGRHVPITPELRALIDQKLARVLRQVNDSGISASVIVAEQKFQKIVEVSLHARGERFLHAVARALTWELAVNKAVEKLEQQTRKMKGKWQERKKGRARALDVAGDVDPVAPAEAMSSTPPSGVVRAVRYEVKVLSLGDAVEAIDEQDAAFLVFRDRESNGIQVIFRRRDGRFGLIDADVDEGARVGARSGPLKMRR